MPIYKKQGKKDGKQKYRVRINYKDSFGEPRQIDRVTFGIDEAKTLEMQLIHDLKDESPARNMTVRQLFDEWCRVKKYEIRESTLEKSKRVLEFHVLPTFENIKLKDLDMKKMSLWKLDMEAKKSSKGSEPLALRTKQGVYKEFRALINYAIKMDYISKNPLVKLGNFKDSNYIKKDMQFYTDKEFAEYISAAKEKAVTDENNGFMSTWDYYVFFMIAFFTGMRKGEIYALTWNDVDLKKGFVSVKRSLSQKIKGPDKITPPKTRSSIRTLQLPSVLINALKEHLIRWKSARGFKNTYFICGGPAPVRDSSLENYNKLFASTAGLHKIRIHDFRHSHVSLLAAKGVNIQEIARRLGHSDIEMTWNTYSHLYPNEEEKAVEILNDLEINV